MTNQIVLRNSNRVDTVKYVDASVIVEEKKKEPLFDKCDIQVFITIVFAVLITFAIFGFCFLLFGKPFCYS